MENDVMDTACQNNHPHLNLHVRGSSHLKCQTCKMNCLQKPNWETSIAPKFQTISTGEEKELTLNCGRNLTLYSCYSFTAACTSRLHPLCHLDCSSQALILADTRTQRFHWKPLVPWEIQEQVFSYAKHKTNHNVTNYWSFLLQSTQSLQTNPLFEKTV